MVKVTQRIEGRRYSRRKVAVARAPDGDLYFESIDPGSIYGASSLSRHKAAALAALSRAGIDAAALLQSGGAGMLRDFVLNAREHAPDSLIGLAARIVELCDRLEALHALNAPTSSIAGDAYRLGQLVIMARAYTIDGQQRQAAAKAPRKAARDSLREAIVRAFRSHRQAGRTFYEALRALAQPGNPVTVRHEKADDQFHACADDARKAKRYTLKGLEALWTAAGKRKPRANGR